jgi:hypothetical protein
MRTAIRWGAFLVIAATSAAALANEGADSKDADVEVNDRAEVGAATGEPSRADERRPDRLARATDDGVVEAGTGSAAPTALEDEKASFDERWLREREGYRDGGY